MKDKQPNRHPDLFDDDNPPIAPPADHRPGLVDLVRMLLEEIVFPQSSQESGDDEDYC